MENRYGVKLTSEERDPLQEILQKGKHPSRKIRRAHTLLLADEGQADEAIVATLRTSPSTVHRIRERFVLEGLEAALTEKPRSGGPKKLDGKAEAFLVVTACSTPPEGCKAWSMQLLADRLVKLEIVEALSDETVRRTLKKTI